MGFLFREVRLDDIAYCISRSFDAVIPKPAFGGGAITGSERTSPDLPGLVLSFDGPHSTIELEPHPSTRATSSPETRISVPILKERNPPAFTKL